MQSGSETAGGKDDQKGGVDPQKEAAYWREQHPKQPYAKHGSYEQFEHAYKTGYNSFFQYPGKNFDDLKEDIALGYEEAKPGAALPWDTVVPAVNAAWDGLAGMVSCAIPVAASASGSKPTASAFIARASGEARGGAE